MTLGLLYGFSIGNMERPPAQQLTNPQLIGCLSLRTGSSKRLAIQSKAKPRVTVLCTADLKILTWGVLVYSADDGESKLPRSPKSIPFATGFPLHPELEQAALAETLNPKTRGHRASIDDDALLLESLICIQSHLAESGTGAGHMQGRSCLHSTMH